MKNKNKKRIDENRKMLFFQDFIQNFFNYLYLITKNQIGMVIPLLASFTDSFKNKMKKVNNNLEKMRNNYDSFILHL